MKKIKLILHFSILFVFLIKTNSVQSATFTTIANGNWITGSTWSGGTSPDYNPTNNTDVININHKITITSDFELKGGTVMTITGFDTLIINGNLTFDNNSVLNVNTNAYLIINGNVTNNNNSNNISINGTIKINGNFEGGNGSAVIGGGSMAVTGTVTTDGSGSVFTSTGNCSTPGSCSSSAGSPLPIALLSFLTQVQDQYVLCKWTTASETNNDYFTVEKSLNGFVFETVAIVNGGGTTTSIKNYSAIDSAPFKGVSYYRLKQTDFDGNYTFSQLEVVEFQVKKNENFRFNFFPNPCTGENLTITLDSEKWDEVLVIVYDIFGKEVYSKVHINSIEGKNVYSMDFSHKLSAGVYMIGATSKENIVYKKLIVN